MTISRRTAIATLATLAATRLTAGRASAAGYPERTIRFIVPFAAGGNADIVGRIVADVVSKGVGQPVVVENRAGAGGGVGADYAAKSAPDGYTLLVASNGPLTVNPFVNAHLGYDPLTDLAAVALAAYVPHVPVMSAKSGIKSIPELIAASKSRPVTIATSGVGSATHMTLERFKHTTGAGITHVPYRGGGALLPDVISGNIDGALTELSTAVELHNAKQARIVGVASDHRSKLVPDVPTFEEGGVKGFVAQSYVGIVAPAKVPADVIDKLSKAVLAGLVAGSPSAEKLIGLGSEIATPEQMTPAGFTAFIKREYAEMKDAARIAGIVPN